MERKRRARFKPRATQLTGRRWEFPGVGSIEVAHATTSRCRSIDDEWIQRRRDDDVHKDWRWTTIVEERAPEAFVLLRDAAVFAVWASEVRSPLTLRDGDYYRFDFLEIDPALRGRKYGVAAIAMVAARARELGAAGLVMAAFNVPKLIKFYEAVGADQRLAAGWTCPKELVPLVVTAPNLATLVKAVDEAEIT